MLYNLPKLARKQVRLLITTRALDMEGVTRPVETVVCPARHDTITVGSCRQCHCFRRIEHNQALGDGVSCASGGAAVQSPSQSAHTMSVQEKVRLPEVCASVHTTLAVLLRYAERLNPWDALPILDGRAMPVGVVTGADIRRLNATGLDPTERIGRVMQSSFATAYPSMSLLDAAELRPANGYRGVVVISDDESFLGIVSEHDLELAVSRMRATSAPDV